MPNRVLVCNDDEVLREILASFLRKKGCEVSEAKNSHECLALMREHRFDTVIFDIKMPDPDGATVVREIERLGTRTQTIIVHPEKELSEIKRSETELFSKRSDLDSGVESVNINDKASLRKILVVDDEDVLRNLVKDFLIEQGYDITDVINGKECVATLQTEQFDAIFMDVRMPEMDGLQALEILRKNGIKTPVILMSGYGEICSTEDAKQRGAQSFLPKPFKLRDALEVLLNDEA